MPITQDRLIRLIDIATKSLNWGEQIKVSTEHNLTSSLEVINSLSDETDITRIRYGLNIMKGNLVNALSLFREHPLSLKDMIALGEERGHFNATSRRNTAIKNQLRFSRAKKTDEAIATQNAAVMTPEHIAEVEAELHAMWVQEPTPAQEQAQAPMPTPQNYRPIGDSDELNMPAPKVKG